MRTPTNDRPLTADIPTPVAGVEPLLNSGAEDLRPPRPTKKQQDGVAESERRCILSGEHGTRNALIRLALSPDGLLVPDILARAPGRGAWIGVDLPTLETAVAKGKIKGALARAFKGEPVRLPDDLPNAIADAFERLFLAQIGMAAKAGALLTGAEKVDDAARSGQVIQLYHAADAAEDGRRKRDQSWRVGEDAEGSGKMGRILPVDRTALSVALGRDNAVHIAIIDAGWGERLSALLDRWQCYAGWSRGNHVPGAPTPDENPSPDQPATAKLLFEGSNGFHE